MGLSSNQSAPRPAGREPILTGVGQAFQPVTDRLESRSHTAHRDGFLGELLTSRVDRLVEYIRGRGAWAQRNSLWPMPYATACCGIELMATGASRYDVGRFGAEAMRFSPRQSDLLICAGRVAIKMMPVLQRIYVQMCEPKWVISMGACASSGGLFDTYAVVQGIDQFLPVDVYVPGCPPRPETLLEGIMAIQRIIDTEGVKTSVERGKGLGLVVGPAVEGQRVK